MQHVDHQAQGLAEQLRRRLAIEDNPQPQGPGDARHALAVFRQLRRSGSNLELDWLWLATQLPDAADQRYSLEQALSINPENHAARRELSRLVQWQKREVGSENARSIFVHGPADT